MTEREEASLNRIASFTVDHDRLEPGIYVSRRDGDVTTYDLRTRKPNAGDYMDNRTMHSVEHMFATFIRNSEIRDSVIYFGPMGCQTGFYLLTRDVPDERVLEIVKDVLDKILAYTFADISDVDTIITDKELPEDMAAKAKAAGCEIRIA